MISAVKLKGRMADTSIFSIIINKLCHRKKLCPIILLKVDKDLEVSFHCAILPFSLTICLWMEGNREFLLDIEEIA